MKHILSELEWAPFSEHDVNELVSVNAQCDTHPWSAQNFIDSVNAGHFCLCVKYKLQVVGFIVMQNKLEDAEILLICVLPRFQRLSIGAALLTRAINASKDKCARFFLEVRESNSRAISFYDSLGFNCIGERKNYYPAKVGRENALIFAMESL